MEGDFAPAIHLQKIGKSFWNSSGVLWRNCWEHFLLPDTSEWKYLYPVQLSTFNSPLQLPDKHGCFHWVHLVQLQIPDNPYFTRGKRSPHKLPPANQRGRNLPRALVRNAPGNSCCPELCRRLDWCVFCAQQWKMPLLSFPTELVSQFTLDFSHASLEKKGQVFLLQRSGENTVRQWGLAGTKLQSTRVVLLVPLSDQPHFSHSLSAAGTAQHQHSHLAELTGDKLGGPEPPGEARSSTWASQAQLGSGAFILLLHWQHPTGSHTTSSLFIREKKQPQSGHKREKICMGTHGPTCALSGQQYCQERCGTWPKKPQHSNKTQWKLNYEVANAVAGVSGDARERERAGTALSICQGLGDTAGWHGWVTGRAGQSDRARSQHLIRAALQVLPDNCQAAKEFWRRFQRTVMKGLCELLGRAPLKREGLGREWSMETKI